MISKYNRYNIILILLFTNTIAISEEQSLKDKPIVDNMISNDPVVDDISVGSSIENKENPNHDNQDNEDNQKNNKHNDESKPQSIESSQLSQSLKGSKHKTVNNKSKVSPGLSKGAKISLGAIGVGGVGWVIHELGESDQPIISSLNPSSDIGPSSTIVSFNSSSNKPLRKQSISSLAISQEPSSSKKDQPIISSLNSSATQLNQKQYYSLDQLEKRNTLFAKLKTIRNYQINENELKRIKQDFPQFNIKEKIDYLLLFCNYNVKISDHLISLVTKQEIQEIQQLLKNLSNEGYPYYHDRYIYGILKLWDIIIENSNINTIDKKQELFLILIDFNANIQTNVIQTKIKEIDEMVKNMIDEKNYHDLLILLLIFNKASCIINDEHGYLIQLSEYFLSKLQSKEIITILLSEIEFLNHTEVEMYNFLPWDVHEITQCLQYHNREARTN